MSDFDISASILAADPLRIAEDLASLNEEADQIHLDVMDFHFAENSFGTLPMLKRLKEVTETPIEVHLMVQDVMNWGPRFAAQGADRMILHAEISDRIDLSEAARAVKAEGAEPVLALLYYTPMENFFDQIKDFSTVLLVTVPETGFGSQVTEQGSFDRIAEMNAEIQRQGLDTRIAVDGGIGMHNIQQAYRAGARQFIVGSDIFRSEDRVARLAELRTHAAQ